jgi:hypothetical protein
MKKVKKVKQVKNVLAQQAALQHPALADSVKVTPPPIFTMLEDAASKGKEVESIHDGLLQSALVGIPFPSFVCEIMFHESVLALGRLICIDGMQDTLKSGLLFEMMRWFLDAAGSGQIVDTEGKSKQSWGPSIIGAERFGHFRYETIEQFEEAQTLVQNMIKFARVSFVRKGKFAPLLLGIDSTTGVLTTSERTKIHTAGYAGKGYSSVANETARWLPSVVKDFMDLPIVLVGIRHEREREVAIGGSSVKVPEPKGATEWSFHAYRSFHVQNDARGIIDLATHGGRNLLICPKKGTMKGVRIPLRVIWWEERLRDNDTGVEGFVQRTKFCWDRSTFLMLTNMDKQGIPKRFQSRVHEVLGPLRANLDRVICKPLGLDTAATCEEFSQALYHPSNASVLTDLRNALAITAGYAFTGNCGVLFDDAKEAQRNKLIREREMLTLGTMETTAWSQSKKTEVEEEWTAPAAEAVVPPKNTAEEDSEYDGY